MNDTATLAPGQPIPAAVNAETHDIVVDEVFPHAPEVVWKALTTADLIGRWMMTPAGFEPVVGAKFSFQTPADGEWDGMIHCEVLEAEPPARLVYSWRTGSQGPAGYVPRLDTVVSFSLTATEGGSRLRLTHTGFVLPNNANPFRNISEGWPKVLGKLAAMLAEQGG